MTGNGAPNIFNARIRLQHFQCVGCDKKILWYSIGQALGLVCTGWSPLALLGKSIHRLGLTQEVRAAESTSRLYLQNPVTGKLFKSCLAALEPPTERFLKNSLEWCLVEIMLLVAVLGGSGAVSCCMVEHMDGYGAEREFSQR